MQEDKLSQEDRLSIEEDILLSDISSDDMPFSQESENTDMAVESLQPSKKKRKKWHFHFRNPLPIIDRYILGKFLGTYFLATALLLLVIAMFDVTEKLDAFLTAPIKETLFDYFASFLPYFANQLSPLFVFISVIFFTTKLADNSEIIAMLSSGITFHRLLRPYMIGAAIIAALTFALSNYIIPPTNVKRIAYTNKYVKNRAVEYGSNIQLMVRPDVVAYIGRFDNTTKRGYRFSLDQFKEKAIGSRLNGSSVEYDSTKMYLSRIHIS